MPYNALGAVDSDQKFIDVRMNAVKRKILILSGKGGKGACTGDKINEIISRVFYHHVGVGKSSVAAALAMALASLTSKVNLYTFSYAVFDEQSKFLYVLQLSSIGWYLGP